MNKSKNMIAYIPKNTIIDKLNPLTKLIFLICYIILIFTWKNYIFLTNMFLFCLIIAFVSKIENSFFYYLYKIVISLILIIFIMQSLVYPKNKIILYSFYFIKIYKEGFLYASLLSLRIIDLVCISLVFIMTTKPQKLVNVLQKKGMSSKFAYVILATLQIAPQMSRKVVKIKEAQISRGLRVKGNIITRFKAFIPLLSPLISSSLVEVEERALSLEIRGFNSKTNKTDIYEVSDPNIERILRYILVFSTLLFIIWRVAA